MFIKIFYDDKVINLKYIEGDFDLKKKTSTKKGGDEEDEKDIEDKSFDDFLENIDFDENQITKKVEKKPIKKFDKSKSSNIIIYPEDNIYDLKEKIFLSTGIQPYKQLLYIKSGKIFIPLYYEIELENKTLLKFEPPNLEKFQKNKKNENSFFGFEINSKFYQNQESFRIKNFEKNFIMDILVQKYSDEIYLENFDDYFTKDLIEKLSTSDSYVREQIYFSFVVLYFPYMSLSIFNHVILNGGIFQNFELDQNDLIIKYDLQKKIRSISEEKSDVEVGSSITSSTIVVEGNAILNIRNLFDLFSLSEEVPYCHAVILNQNKKVLLQKTYKDYDYKSFDQFVFLDSFTTIIHIGNTKERSSSRGKSTNMLDIYLILSIQSNGKCLIKSIWREDYYFSIEDIFQICKTFANPIIDIINNFDSKIFNDQRRLYKISRVTGKIKNMNLNLYWQVMLTENDKLLITKILNEFILAGIFRKRDSSLKIIGSYTFLKGMFTIDQKIDEFFEKQTSNDFLIYSNENLKNYYENLINQFHQFNIIHRFSDIRFEIINIKESEIEFFFRYVYALILMMKEILDKNSKKVEKSDKKDGKRLILMREQDPKLFDFRRLYGTNSSIYSVKCQKQHQPLYLINPSKKEMEDAKKDAKNNYERKNGVVMYYNFTKKSEAYYKCTDPVFSYLRFLTGIHPKDYCLPCCQKMPTTVENRSNVTSYKQQIHKTCMTDFRFIGKKETINSRYVMNYNKPIEPGRIAYLPEDTLNILFYDIYTRTSKGINTELIKKNSDKRSKTKKIIKDEESEENEKDKNKKLKENEENEENKKDDKKLSTKKRLKEEKKTQSDYCIYGVQQDLPNISNIGLLFIFANVLELNFTDFIVDVTKKINNSPNLFPQLLDGRIYKFFPNHSILIEYININFNLSDQLSNQYISQENWNNIFKSIAEIYYNIQIIIFIDTSHEYEEQNSDFKLELPGKINSHQEILLLDNYKKVVVIKKITNSGKIYFYPIYDISLFNYYKNGQIKSKFLKNSNLSFIKNMTRFFISKNFNQFQFLHLQIINDFIKSNLKYFIKMQYINKHNLCYAIILTNSEKNKNIFIPIFDSQPIFEIAHITKVLILGKDNFEEEILDIFIEDFNNFIKKDQTKNNLILKKNYKLIYDKKIIGYEINKLNFYLTSVNKNSELEKIQEKILRYHPDEINMVISSNQQSNIEYNSFYKVYEFQLLLWEFNIYFSKQKNTKIRKEINGFFDNKTFQNNNTSLEFYNFLIQNNISQQDIKLLMAQYKTSNNFTHFIDMTNSYRYNFDHQYIDDLHNKSYKEIIEELNYIGSQILYFDTPHLTNFPNILNACQNENGSYVYLRNTTDIRVSEKQEVKNLFDKSVEAKVQQKLNKESTKEYCMKHKLIIPQKDFEEFIKIIAYNIKNPLLKNFFLFSEIVGTVEIFNFIIRPNEEIFISFV